MQHAPAYKTEFADVKTFTKDLLISPQKIVCTDLNNAGIAQKNVFDIVVVYWQKNKVSVLKGELQQHAMVELS
jgi:hypothetical protein